MNGTPGQKLKSKNPPVQRRWHKKERQVFVIPVFLGPSDWIRTSGRPTASPGRPCGEIEIHEAAGSQALAKKERQIHIIPVFLGPSDATVSIQKP